MKNTGVFFFLVFDEFILISLFCFLQGKGLFFVNQTESSYRLKLFLEQFHVRSAVLNAELPLNSRLHILQVIFLHYSMMIQLSRTEVGVPFFFFLRCHLFM